MAGKLPGSAIQSNTISITQIQTTAITSIVEQAGPRVTSLIYPGNDTAGNTVGGQTVYIVGSGFETNNAIYINGNAVPSKSFISASNLSFTTPALSAGIYPVYVINTDSGATAIFVPGYISSGEPTWVTGASLSDIGSTDPWSISLSATGDAPITYALADGSSLPNGITLAANGLISGTMSSPPESQTQYTFTVVASDAQNQDASRQFTVTVTTGEGVLFANNVLLIHADGTNNKNNHHFLDSSNNNLTITRAGNATQGSFSPFSQTGWSAYFDGNGDSLTYTGGSSINFGTSDFTIELYVNMANTGTFSAFLRPDDTGTFPEFGYDWSTSELKFQARDGAIATISTSITPNVWKHIAVSRSGTSLRLFVDGTQVGSTITNSTNFGSPTNAIRIAGSSFSGTHSVNGYISNFRIVKGTALYTTTFTPPTSALTAIANTSLLTLQSNRFIDNSTNAFTITRNGDTSIQPFSPFAPTDVYSTANVGGSVYLDGNGDYLTPADSTATDLGISRQPFTLEWWTYFTTTSGGQYIFNKGGGTAGWNSTTGWQYVFSIEFSSSVFSLGYYNGSSYTYWQPSFSSINVFGRWNHMVLSYDGTNLSAYINGTRIGTTTVTNFTKPSSSNKCGIGSTVGITGEAYYYNGYISDFRLVQGNAIYDPTLSTLTVPTSPLTNAANTSLLLNFTNAGIFDQTAKNVLETVGDAKVSTAQYKYGTGSIAFDGTGDYLVTPSSPLNALGSGDFTIEMWLYPSNTSSAYRAIIASDAYAATTNGWSVYQNGTSIEMYYSSGGSTPSIFTATSALTSSVWQHFALVRSSGTLKAYVNGTQVASVSNSINFVGNRIFIGDNNAGDYFFNGYIDDLRVTKGYARYTSNFTPPASALKDK